MEAEGKKALFCLRIFVSGGAHPSVMKVAVSNESSRHCRCAMVPGGGRGRGERATAISDARSARAIEGWDRPVDDWLRLRDSVLVALQRAESFV